jgi:hypothetical protein
LPFSIVTKPRFRSAFAQVCRFAAIEKTTGKWQFVSGGALS